MPIREVVEAFNKHVENIPSRFIQIDATPGIISRDAVKRKHISIVESITEADIEQNTSYTNQSREKVIENIVKGVIKYAVLSHTWQTAGEFEYRDMISPNSVRDGPGWRKLEKFIGIAKGTFKCRFAWADMACIDGTPGERQAVAKSGFDWCRNAYVCIVYLSTTRSLLELDHDGWFRRGWTLLELLAPIRIKFYGAGWQPLNAEGPKAENDKADMNFLDKLSNASGISVDDLQSFLPGPNRVREKLTWASKRETSVPADTAYCLISIFVSHMEAGQPDPEEREMAFLRLMLHIIPKSRECDAFAWAGKRAENHPAVPSSPACYGTHHRDYEFNQDTHRYRLCGDRSFSLGYDHLRIRVISINVSLRKRIWGTGYEVKSHSHKAFISGVEPLPPYFGAKTTTIGVIDYNWTDDPGEGEMHAEERYFGFLLHMNAEQTRWEKVDTKKVVFLESKETKKHKLEMLVLDAQVRAPYNDQV